MDRKRICVEAYEYLIFTILNACYINILKWKYQKKKMCDLNGENPKIKRAQEEIVNLL